MNNTMHVFMLQVQCSEINANFVFPYSRLHITKHGSIFRILQINTHEMQHTSYYNM